MEERLGSEAARELLSGTSEPTAAEEAVLGDCLLERASDVSRETVTPELAACLEAELGAGIAALVGTEARALTAKEEAVLGGCLLTSAVAPPPAAVSDTVQTCLQERLGADQAARIISRTAPLAEQEAAVVGDCLLGSAIVQPERTIIQGVSACLAERLGADIAAVVASRAIPLTADEEAVLGECLLYGGSGQFSLNPPTAPAPISPDHALSSADLQRRLLKVRLRDTTGLAREALLGHQLYLLLGQLIGPCRQIA